MDGWALSLPFFDQFEEEDIIFAFRKQLKTQVSHSHLDFQSEKLPVTKRMKRKWRQGHMS